MKNIKKYIAIAFVFVFSLLLFAGCIEKDTMEAFVEIHEDGAIRVYRESSTDILYVTHGAGGMTVMVNDDGTPLLYDEWIEKREQKSASAY